MVKKYLVCIIAIICVFALSVSVFAQPDTNTDTNGTVQEQMPMEGGRMGGGRQGGMGGGPPSENMTMPENGEGMQKPDDAPKMAENPQGDEQMSQEGGTSDNPQMQMPNKGNRGDMMFDNGGFDNENQDVATENEQSTSSIINFVKEYQTPIISVVLLLLAFVFVKLYKRKNY